MRYLKWLPLIIAPLAVQRWLRHRRAVPLDGKVVLITGGSRGLGFLLAQEFAREGCSVAICARDEPELRAAQQRLMWQGAEVLALVCDVSDEAQVHYMIDQVTAHYGRIDILVNNAAALSVGALSALTLEDFHEAMNVMFWGVVHSTLAILPQMRERRSGQIVNITSIGGKVSLPHMLHYSAAKFAATGFSEGLRAELSQDGIVITTIVPGLMRSGAFQNTRFKGEQEREYTWFALADSLPGISVSAEKVARSVIDATIHGDAERILSLPASIMARVNGLFPGISSNLLALVDRFVLPPHVSATAEASLGVEIQQRIQSPLLNLLLTMGTNAAKRLNQFARLNAHAMITDQRGGYPADPTR